MVLHEGNTRRFPSARCLAQKLVAGLVIPSISCPRQSWSSRETRALVLSYMSAGASSCVKSREDWPGPGTKWGHDHPYSIAEEIFYCRHEGGYSQRHLEGERERGDHKREAGGHMATLTGSYRNQSWRKGSPWTGEVKDGGQVG